MDAMNKRTHQVPFLGKDSVVGTHTSSRTGVTSSGFGSQHPVGASSVSAPADTEEVNPLEECSFSLHKQKLGLSKADGKGRGGGPAMAGGFRTIE